MATQIIKSNKTSPGPNINALYTHSIHLHHVSTSLAHDVQEGIFCLVMLTGKQAVRSTHMDITVPNTRKRSL